MDYREVSLDTLNSGSIRDLFEEEFQKLMNNIADDNTQADKPRSITIKVTVKPNKDRSNAGTLVAVTSSLAPVKPHEGFIVLSNDGNKIKAFTTDINQPDLPYEDNASIIQMPKMRGVK